MCDSFVHIHSHSEYSKLDGLGSPEILAKTAKSLGQPGLAITDHGNISGVVEFYRECKKQDIIPIIGMEGYICRYGADMSEKNSSNRGSNHMLLLSETDEGYKNLVHLSSIANIHGFYYNPRMDYALLEKHTKGLIATTGCMAAPIPRMILDNHTWKDIQNVIDWHIQVFGRDNLYVELQHHPGIPELVDLNKKLISVAKHYKLKMVATNDVHYATPQDARPHDILLCVQTKSHVNNPNRMKFTDDEYYIKTRSEMEKDFAPYGLDNSIFDNSIEIMERCSGLNLEVEDKIARMPNIVINSGRNYNDELEQLTIDGMAEYYGKDWKNDQVLVDRVDEELSAIKQTGYAVYYHIIHDICKYAREHNIVWNVRGSGAGSIVSYVLGMSFIDPIENKLLFSRFINIERVSVPDFDMDFPDDAREEIIQYISNKYGKDHTAQIIIFGRMKARMCVRDIARAYGWEQIKTDALANKIPNIPGKPITIENSLDPDSEYYSSVLKKEYDEVKESRFILDQAKTLEKTIRHAGIHAAAIAVADRPLIEYVPIGLGSKTAVTDYVAQFDYPTLESLGILKIDVLGLATLSIVRKCCELIKERYSVNIVYDNIPFENEGAENALKLLQSGEVTGVFQVESQGLRQILTSLKPETFGEVMDVISLYRPGPIDYIPIYIDRARNGVEIEYRHPLLEEIMSETQGIMIYQEQVMLALQKLAGYTLGEADLVRKGISKKDQKIIDTERQHFVKGCKELNNIDEQLAVEIYNDISKFALYGFNRAHAASYARMTMVTAWLKANYPVEFIAACLHIEGKKSEKVASYVSESKKMGIPVLGPDINKSGKYFVIEDDSLEYTEPYSKYEYLIPPGSAIRFGYDSIKHLGDVGAESLLAAKGKVESVDDILSIDFSNLNIRSLRRVAAAGTFDNFIDRKILFGNEERIISYAKNARHIYKGGQYSFAKPLLDLNEVEKVDLSQEEKESLGIWLTYDPMDKYKDKIDIINCNIHDINSNPELLPDNPVMLLFVSDIKDITTKNGKSMSFVTFSDIYGTFEGVLFPNRYKHYRRMLEKESIILATGAFSQQNDEISLVIESVYTHISI